MNESPNNIGNQRPLAPILDEEWADGIGAAISESLGEVERAIEAKLERKFEERLRALELSFAKLEGKLEAFIGERGSRGRR